MHCIYAIYLAYYDTVIWSSLRYTRSYILKCPVYTTGMDSDIWILGIPYDLDRESLGTQTMRSRWHKVWLATRTAAAASLPPCAETSKSGWNKNLVRSLVHDPDAEDIKNRRFTINIWFYITWKKYSGKRRLGHHASDLRLWVLESQVSIQFSSSSESTSGRYGPGPRDTMICPGRRRLQVTVGYYEVLSFNRYQTYIEFSYFNTSSRIDITIMASTFLGYTSSGPVSRCPGPGRPVLACIAGSAIMMCFNTGIAGKASQRA